MDAIVMTDKCVNAFVMTISFVVTTACNCNNM